MIERLEHFQQRFHYDVAQTRFRRSNIYTKTKLKNTRERNALHYGNENNKNTQRSTKTIKSMMGRSEEQTPVSALLGERFMLLNKGK